ncbi:MAG: class I SAM-dependent methyltransferase [Paracoccaceae bacterium]
MKPRTNSYASWACGLFDRTRKRYIVRQTHRYSKASDTYASGRLDYPVEIAGWLTETVALSAASTVLDLGAGTGKFTKVLARTDARVIAVEPVDAMRDQLCQYVPEITALAGSAENIPLVDSSVDVVVCAQSFHWFATQSALTEIHRVLRPGGKFALIWNVRDERRQWVRALSEIMQPYEAGTPRLYKGKWREPFESGLF